MIVEKRKTKMNALDLVYTAIGVALISVCAWITVPMTVQFTLQTFAVFAVALILGGERGTIATCIYVLMGTIGLPVFSGFTGGVGVLLGKTGGYIIGFLFIGPIYLLFTKLRGKKEVLEIASLILGLIVCYAFGTAWFMYVYMKQTGPVGLMAVLSWCVFPFIIPDLVKLAVAYVVAKRVRPIIK